MKLKYQVEFMHPPTSSENTNGSNVRRRIEMRIFNKIIFNKDSLWEYALLNEWWMEAS
jgi:hypothetical protein